MSYAVMTEQLVCTFFLEDTYFGIAVEAVQEVIQNQPTTRVPLAPQDVCGLLNLRGQVIPVIDLPCRLGMRSVSCGLDQTRYNVVVRTLDDVVSFLVDDIDDVLTCPIALFEPPPATLNRQMRSFLRGAYKLDQDFLLLLDVAKLVDPGAANPLN
jgi:purine-binding chemotaxis protein CheW